MKLPPPRQLLAALLCGSTLLGLPPLRAENAIPALVEPAKPTVKPYPLDTCIVSGEKLGDMGKPVVFEYQGQEIKLCCKSCRKKFDKDPAKLIKQMEENAKKPEKDVGK